LRLLEQDPDERIAALVSSLRTDMAAAADEAAAMRILRRMKAEAALLIALCDIGGVWPVMRVTAALTDVAVTATRCCVRWLLAQEAARGRIVPPDPADPEAGSGLVVLAMGKMGAGELNYSSDVDLIVFYDADANSLKADIEPQPFFVRIAQGMARLMQQRTGDGYVFRVDLRLRPDPASTPVAVSTTSALAQLPIPITFKPKRGSASTYERVREQARLQVASRDRIPPLHELLSVVAKYHQRC